jgi:hypothetical protein
VHSVGLKARRRIGTLRLRSELKKIARAGRHVLDCAAVITAVGPLERDETIGFEQANGDVFDRRRPDAKAAGVSSEINRAHTFGFG